MNKMKFKIIVILLISIFMINSGVLAVENYMNFIPLEGDISQNVVKAILQDKNGFMWFGSNDGLTKYDGYRIKKYRQMPFGENTLLDNYIIDLEEDKNGDIWVATSKGLTKLNPKEEIFTNYETDISSLNKINSKKISAILEDKKKNLWVGTSDKGLNKYDETKDQFINYEVDLTSQNITTIYEDKMGYLWIGTKNGVNRVNIKTNEVVSYIHNTYITAIYQDFFGDIWVGTKDNGLNKIDLKTKNITKYLKDDLDSYSIGSNHITSIIEDKNGTLWIGTKQGGLARYDREKEHFVKRLSDSRDAASNKQKNILTLYQDDSGLIWVGMEYGGVSKFNPLANFQNYKSVENFDNTMNDNNVLSIYKDKEGYIWAGTKNGGVNKLDLEKRTIKYYEHNINDKNSISSNTVSHIMEDSKGLMWFATDMGLNILDKKTEKIKRYIYDQNEKSNNVINYIFEDSYNDIWIGTEVGLLKYERDSGEHIYINKEKNGLSGKNITTIFEDSNKDIWIGTFNDGLNKYSRENEQIKTYKNNPQNEKTISNDQIKTIVEDEQGNLWIGTSNGLNKFNKRTGEFKVFTENNQFKSNFISGILMYDDYLWISGNEGISKFDIKSEKVIKSYSVIDGLQGSYFNSGSVYKSEDGQLLFGGTEGFNTIYPYREKEKSYTPNIVLSHFKANEKIIDVTDKKELILPYNENKLYFEFGITDYKKPSNNNHYLKLEGYDKVWHDIKNRDYGVYDSLPPGNYTLNIKGVNSEGVWVKDDLKLKITIKPPIWKTKSAYVIYTLLIILLIILVLNYVKLLERMVNERTNELNKTNNRLLKEIEQRKKAEEVLKMTIEENERLFNEKMEVENLRNDFFINLSHELRTPLNIIISTIQLSEMYLKEGIKKDIVPKVKTHLKTIRKNCYRLLKTVNNIIDVAKIESNQYELNKKLINIVYLIEDVVESTINYAKDKNIKVIFDTQTEEEIVKCDPIEVERVILNIMSNAIKYSNDNGNVWVNIYKKNRNVEIAIKDDGIGIPKSKQNIIFEKFKKADENRKLGSGIGLNLSKLLIDLHEGELDFNSEEGYGSEFIIRLPSYDIQEDEYEKIVDLETLEKEDMELEIEMSELK